MVVTDSIQLSRTFRGPFRLFPFGICQVESLEVHDDMATFFALECNKLHLNYLFNSEIIQTHTSFLSRIHSKFESRLMGLCLSFPCEILVRLKG